jgi:hypothetical protein
MAAKHMGKREAMPPIVTLFRQGNGDIHHSRCGSRISFHGARGGGVEFDFYCVACPAHITIPRVAFERIPMLGTPEPRYLERIEGNEGPAYALTPSGRSTDRAEWRGQRVMTAS